MAGGVFTGANPGYTTRELAFQLRDSEASIMIAAEGALGTAMEAAAEVGMAAGSIFMFDSSRPDSPAIDNMPRGGNRHWTDLVASRTKGDDFVWAEPQDSKSVVCTLNYSSGTVCWEHVGC